MSSPQRPLPKQSSRWGGFLQQAVASVESRLDTILADEEDLPKKSIVPEQQARGNVTPRPATADLSRSNSGAQKNDRLQQRLARAMAKKNASGTDISTAGSEATSAATTPILKSSEPKATDSTTPTEKGDAAGVKSDEDAGPQAEPITDSQGSDDGQAQPESDSPPYSLASESPRNSEEGMRSASGYSKDEGLGDTEATKADSTQSEPQNEQSRITDDAESKRSQEEINGYIERIDALQAKLQYLTKEAADSAKQAAAAAEAGSVEKKLLEKDGKIALLLEEGQKLSKTEMKHLTAIKSLRSQAVTAKKEQFNVKIRAEKAEKSVSVMEERARRAEVAMKRTEEKLALSLSTAKDFEAVTKERNALTATISDIKSQLSRANTRAEAAEAKAQSDLVEKMKKRNDVLQDDLTSVKVERELSEEKLKREINDLRASLEREKEHSRAIETEMLGEQAALESKLESTRARVEEASSDNQGEVQAKLLRQIETLQSQYVAASQNWQGIESTLLTRIANLEKERDDATGREADVRRKVRDLTSTAKHAEREAEASNSSVADLERQQAHTENELQKALRRVQDSEESLTRVQSELDEHCLGLEKEIMKRIDEEKVKWAASIPVQRLESPAVSTRKGSHYDYGHLMSPTFTDRAHGRRPSTMQGPESNTPPRQYSTASFKALSNGAMPETPSILTSLEQEEYFTNVPHTPASTKAASTRGVNDLISNSTVGAGPSVQLVERMSANVRRLESEKAASKDDLVRLSTQRDEARREIVSLMKEVEVKRAVEERIKALEAEHKSLNERHQTTLEMLGEKSEQVEELKADVADVKQMYRDLADTLK